MGGLNWNGNRRPKLSYKSEGLEKLFLQLIKENLTNLDKFPHWTTKTYWIRPLFVPPTRISEKNFPINRKKVRGTGGGVGTLMNRELLL